MHPSSSPATPKTLPHRSIIPHLTQTDSFLTGPSGKALHLHQKVAQSCSGRARRVTRPRLSPREIFVSRYDEKPPEHHKTLGMRARKPNWANRRWRRVLHTHQICCRERIGAELNL